MAVRLGHRLPKSPPRRRSRHCRCRCCASRTSATSGDCLVDPEHVAAPGSQARTLAWTALDRPPAGSRPPPRHRGNRHCCCCHHPSSVGGAAELVPALGRVLVLVLVLVLVRQMRSQLASEPGQWRLRRLTWVLGYAVTPQTPRAPAGSRQSPCVGRCPQTGRIRTHWTELQWCPQTPRHPPCRRPCDPRHSLACCPCFQRSCAVGCPRAGGRGRHAQLGRFTRADKAAWRAQAVATDGSRTHSNPGTDAPTQLTTSTARLSTPDSPRQTTQESVAMRAQHSHVC